MKDLHRVFSQSDQVSLCENSADMLLVCESAFDFPCFLLDATSINFIFHTLLHRLEPLSLDQFCVSDFFVFLRLNLHSLKFFFHQDFHSCLLKRPHTQHV